MPAVPATRRPMPKTTGAPSSTALGPWASDQRPARTVPITLVAMKARNGQPYDETLPRSAIRAGIAVPTPMFSKATMVISSTIPTVTARWLGPNSSSRTLLCSTVMGPACPVDGGAGQRLSGAIGSWRPSADRPPEVPHASARRGRGDRREAGQGRAERQPDRLGDRRLHPRRGRRRADVRAGDGDPAQRDEPPRDRAVDRGDDRQRRTDGLLLAVAAHRGQALHRRGRGQDHAAAGAAGRGLRGGRAAAVRARPRPHRRHPRQAGVDPGLAGDPVQRGDDQPARGRGCRRLRGRGGAGTRGQEALRAPRRHRDRGGDPADRVARS